MATEKFRSLQRNYPNVPYTETLLIVAGVVVLVTWAFLLSTGSHYFNFLVKPGSSMNTLDPVSTVLGFILVGLGLLEFGLVVWMVQLAWVLPKDHDESGVSPFLCCYCLLGQFLLMFPPLIMVGVVVIPIGLFTLAYVGWYCQKFTGLKLSVRGHEQYQNPITMWDLLMMPIYMVSFALFPLGIVAFFTMNVRGTWIITITIGMLVGALVPLLVCYGFLAMYRLKNSVRRMIWLMVIGCLMVCACLEGLLSHGSSGISIAIAFALAMLVAGMRLGLQPWLLNGVEVVIAKPTLAPSTRTEVGFDEVL